MIMLAYTSATLLALRDAPLSQTWPMDLPKAYCKDGFWSPERWHASKRNLRGFLIKVFNKILKGPGRWEVRDEPGAALTDQQLGPSDGTGGRGGEGGSEMARWSEGLPIPVMVGRSRDGERGGRGERPRFVQAVALSRPLSSSCSPNGNRVRHPGVRLMYLNARSVMNKALLVRDLIEEEDADLACITETWLGPEGGVPLSDLCPPGFRILHQPRLHGRGGGVAVLMRESLSPREVTVPQIGGCELLLVRWDPGVQSGLLVTYLSPSCVASALPALLDVLTELVVELPNLLVVGDFNLPSAGRTSELVREFMASMTAMDLTQIVQDPTHIGGHTLDLIFLSGQWINDRGEGTLSITPLSWTDHSLLRLDFPTTITCCRSVEPVRWFRPRRLMEPERFQRELGLFPSSLAQDSSETLVAAWERAVVGALDRIAPLRPLIRRRSQVAPWFTAELREMKRRKRRLEGGWRASRSEADRTQLRNHIRSYLVAMEEAKRNYFASLIASAENRPAALFRVTRSLLNQVVREDPLQGRAEDFAFFLQDKIAQIRTGLDSDQTESTEMTEACLDGNIWIEFEPVSLGDVVRIVGRLRSTTCLLDPCPSWLVSAAREVTGDWIQAVTNASLREGVFPASLKEAVVRPLLKKPSLDPDILNNYRPVSNLRFLAKVVESVVAQQFPQFLDETDYLDPYQSGFRRGHSTETALVALVNDLWRARDEGCSSILVLLDLSAAFDTIDHGILLQRLGEIGVGGTVMRWFSSYLSDRLQSVWAGGQGSSQRPLTCGVPQGSVLSPLLFNIYMKPLGEIIRGFGVRYHQYADDTQLYISTPDHSSDALSLMSQCLEAVRVWMGKNRLRLNPTKTEWLWMPASQDTEVPTLMIGGEIITPSNRVRNLGVLLDSRLSFDDHLTAVTRGAFAQVRLVRQLRPFLDRDALATVTHALVTSRLDYCNTLYMGLPLECVRRLQLVQNAAARVIMGASRYSRVTPLLRELHWLPVAFRIHFKVLVLTYKALHGLGPVYLQDHLQPLSHRPVRSHRVGLLRVPSARQCRLTTPRRRAFSVGAPTLWNGLPTELRTAPDLRSFRRGLKTWLFHQICFGDPLP